MVNVSEMNEEASKYIKLLKETEELSQEMRALARESFVEGWVQCERAIERNVGPQGLRTGKAEPSG